MLASLLVSITGPVTPRALIAGREKPLSPTLALLGLALATAASAFLLFPFLRAASLRSALFIDDQLVTQAIVFHALVIHPIGACIGALVTGLLLWILPMLAGHDPRWGRCLLVAAAVGGVETARRLFVAGILWLRELTGRVEPGFDVRTGLDALLVALPDLPEAVLTIGRHVGLFEAWTIVVTAVALMLVERMPRRVAIGTAVVAWLCVESVGVVLELLA